MLCEKVYCSHECHRAACVSGMILLTFASFPHLNRNSPLLFFLNHACPLPTQLVAYPSCCARVMKRASMIVTTCRCSPDEFATMFEFWVRVLQADKLDLTQPSISRGIRWNNPSRGGIAADRHGYAHQLEHCGAPFLPSGFDCTDYSTWQPARNNGNFVHDGAANPSPPDSMWHGNNNRLRGQLLSDLAILRMAEFAV